MDGRYIRKIKFRVPGFEEDAKNLHFTERQATAILEMRLYKLIGLEILALQKAYKETLRKIREYQHILSNQKNMDVVIKEDLDCHQGRVRRAEKDTHRGRRRDGLRGGEGSRRRK